VGAQRGHFHVAVPDGVFTLGEGEARAAFHLLARPTEAELSSHEEFFAKLGSSMPEVLQLQRQMFLGRIDSLGKRKWGGSAG
jgi:hypothetical protein